MISFLVLLVGLSMAELASKYPTAGGIYYWAYSLGGVRWAWFTGWFNLLGLVAITAAVDYGCASFLNSVLALYNVNFILNFTTTNASTILHNTFVLFFLILALHSLINVFSSHLVSLLNRISAWWMLGGVVVIVGVLIFGPSAHQSFSWYSPIGINNSGFSGHFYWFFVLPLGFLLTMYTFTGYDASAHLSEETHRRRARRTHGAVDVDRLLGGRRLGTAAGHHVRGDARGRHQPRAAVAPFRSSRRRSAPAWPSWSSTSPSSASCSAGWAASRPPHGWCSRSHATAPCQATHCGDA